MRLLVVGDFQGVFSKNMKRKLEKEEFDAVVAVGDYGGIKDWRPYVMYSLKTSKNGGKRKSPEQFFGKNMFRNLLKKDRNATMCVLKMLNEFGKPVFLIFGNGDDDWYKYPFDKSGFPKKQNLKFLKKLKNIKVMTYGKSKFRGFSLIGFGGYMDIDAYFDKRIWKDESPDKIKRRIIRREKSRKKLFSVLRKTYGERIFVFHYPPKGVFDIIRDKKDNPMNGKSTGIGFFADAIKKHRPLVVFCGHMHEYRGIKKVSGIPVINPGDAEKGKYAVVEIDGGKIGVKFIK